MAIVLLEWAVEAWKNGGNQWQSWSSKIVYMYAWLKVENSFFFIFAIMPLQEL